jgi:hypothetical protein
MDLVKTFIDDALQVYVVTQKINDDILSKHLATRTEPLQKERIDQDVINKPGKVVETTNDAERVNMEKLFKVLMYKNAFVHRCLEVMRDIPHGSIHKHLCAACPFNNTVQIDMSLFCLEIVARSSSLSDFSECAQSMIYAAKNPIAYCIKRTQNADLINGELVQCLQAAAKVVAYAATMSDFHAFPKEKLALQDCLFGSRSLETTLDEHRDANRTYSTDVAYAIKKLLHSHHMDIDTDDIYTMFERFFPFYPQEQYDELKVLGWIQPNINHCIKEYPWTLPWTNNWRFRLRPMPPPTPTVYLHLE